MPTANNYPYITCARHLNSIGVSSGDDRMIFSLVLSLFGLLSVVEGHINYIIQTSTAVNRRAKQYTMYECVCVCVF